ncbi:sensor histidine kinase [Streptomyces orinoci]|uniref:histidine kinase n=1 Tax=Streptomyces orinoci TaxID=67339 RepID=A0ABV3JXY2_STRON|nr:HAMP domain-containing sensor histidine kinase [Streptomyces orinoci]
MSLRTRLVLLAAALVALGLTVSDTLVLGVVRGQLVQRVDQRLTRYGDKLAGRLAAEGVPRATHGGHGSWLPSQYVVAFAGPDGTVSEKFRRPMTAGDPRPCWPAMTAAQLRSRFGHPFEVPGDQGPDHWRALIVPVDRSKDPSLPAGVVVALPLQEVSTTLDQLGTAFLAIGGGTLALLSLAGWFAVRAGLRPLRRIEATAAEIAAGRPLSHRMPQASPRTEAGRLTSALNEMLAQLESAFAARAESERRMRRFMADAGHELRTPLAGIRGFAELHRMGALSGEEETARTMARIESEAIRLGGLVEDLLTLVRLNEQRPLEPAPMDLRTLAVDALHDTRALDPGRTVTLTGPGGEGPPGPAPVHGDEARLRQVVTNLVGNAVAHTPPGTPVRIGVGRTGDQGVLEVADQGPGLTEEQAARVFERFYRADPSRSRGRGGGAGLGLAIVSALVAAHQGQVDLKTAPGQGALFRVRLPLAAGSGTVSASK